MSRSLPAVSGCFLMLMVLGVPAFGQAAAEAGLGAAASGMGAAGARGVNKSLGGAFGKLDETLTGGTGAKPAGSSIPSGSVKPRARNQPAARKTAPPEPAPAVSYEDAMQIQKDIGSEELMRRFGPPAMQIASENDAQTMTYVGKSGAVQVELRNGTVISVAKPKSGA